MILPDLIAINILLKAISWIKNQFVVKLYSGSCIAKYHSRLILCGMINLYNKEII